MRATHPLLRYAQRTFDYGEGYVPLPWYSLMQGETFAKPGFYEDRSNRVLFKVGVPGSDREDDRARVEVVYAENPAYKLGRLSSKVMDPRDHPTDTEEASFHETILKGDGATRTYLTYAEGEDLLRRLRATDPRKGGGTQVNTRRTRSDGGSGGGMSWFLPVGIGLAAIGAVMTAVYWRKSKA